MRNPQKLLLQFLDEAKLHGLTVEPVAFMRTNTFALNNSNVLVRTASDLGKRYFFGLNYISAEEIYNLDNSFVAFICGCIAPDKKRVRQRKFVNYVYAKTV